MPSQSAKQVELVVEAQNPDLSPIENLLKITDDKVMSEKSTTLSNCGIDWMKIKPEQLEIGDVLWAQMCLSN